MYLIENRLLDCAKGLVFPMLQARGPFASNRGSVKVTRIGRRVFLTTEELERIRRDGLLSLVTSPSREVVAKT